VSRNVVKRTCDGQGTGSLLHLHRFPLPCSPIPMTRLPLPIFLALLITAAMPLLAREPVPSVEATVAVGGEVSTPLRVDRAMLAKMPRQKVTASAHHVSGEWEGVPLLDVLRAAGAPLGDALRGPNLALYVRVSASDGYRVVYALAELDPKFRGSQVLLVDRHDGKPLDAGEGPFRIVSVGEARPGRWVRNVTAIDVLRAPE